MMLSFIVTSWNIEDYIGPCLDSLIPCLRPGDQVILVDDGSDDCTCEEIEARFHMLAACGVDLLPVFLGANTQGGVGIPANIGLSEVTGDAVFFVDGDDWVDAAGLNAARQRFETTPCDVLIANYNVYHDTEDRFSAPPDTPLWQRVPAAATPAERRHLALQMVGVPWRKMYRTAFLEKHGLRFPEGPFFYEDNPFHWQVCLAAQDIAFLNQTVCSHRVARAGQTMAATGMELAVFFDHYDRIVSQLPGPKHRPDALRWLLENMAWHIDRMAPSAYWPYALRAQDTLSRIAEGDWTAMRHDPVALRAWGPARLLARGDLAGVVSAWQQQAVLRRLDHLEERLDRTEHETAARLGHLTHMTEGLFAVQEFDALKALRPTRKDGR
ncbi:glycosyltransferase family 2 protein [Donghicola sp. XS_ASV15]|uniref:glycosyltransferase family 2 protein n=1 Tax=Donghicola sp. XS_ASV15 TaxID=3241295 RepID=UPI003514D94F